MPYYYVAAQKTELELSIHGTISPHHVSIALFYALKSKVFSLYKNQCVSIILQYDEFR
ncbi:hypothetical protein PCIT_b0280 [Pseudoalteromonas citrea]|uniref:Uncharacterized protein n=1 Tax=Pseudoalteromonas citrea TaxID=43655 RepID=A0AAD4AE69_9GAMM|nr:hypothetical protein PCIT_b0280 [Pseudoalteromonas citrea]